MPDWIWMPPPCPGYSTRASNFLKSSQILRKNQKLKLVPSTRLTDSIVLPGSSGISESLHDIADEIDVGDLLRERFTIYHLLVAV